ncbi:hypothetical protein KP509_28G063800 [Ceratopteris richardii]|uniref:Uncharacterized protein n=1 Tax=Ceratopteris richardii TaxID=49495 RepID=A0A8T2REI0_CERRI|nr:hypothetical protein KP509_28G063800 [Ceratopteris richardii]
MAFFRSGSYRFQQAYKLKLSFSATSACLCIVLSSGVLFKYNWNSILGTEGSGRTLHVGWRAVAYVHVIIILIIMFYDVDKSSFSRERLSSHLNVDLAKLAYYKLPNVTFIKLYPSYQVEQDSYPLNIT